MPRADFIKLFPAMKSPPDWAAGLIKQKARQVEAIGNLLEADIQRSQEKWLPSRPTPAW